MQALRAYQRRRAVGRVKASAGVKRGRTSGRLAARPREAAAVHGLLADDAAPSLAVWLMYEEAAAFEGMLIELRAQLEEVGDATDDFLERLQPMLRAPLPRVWDAVEGGLAEPTRATISHRHAHTVGGDASVAGLEEARAEMRGRLHAQLLHPLEQWSEALATAEARLPELNRLRAQVIKQSRGVARASDAFKRKERHGGPREPGGAGAIVSASRRPAGMRGLLGACARPRAGAGRRRGGAAAGGDYGDEASSSDESSVESEVQRQVASEEAGMKMAVVSLGNTKQPLPGFADRADVRLPAHEHGVLRDNIALVAGLPPHLGLPQHLRGREAGARGAGAALLPTAGVHAHRATAAPMELAARPGAAALDWVGPAPRGASEVPLSAVEAAGLAPAGAAAAAGSGARGSEAIAPPGRVLGGAGGEGPAQAGPGAFGELRQAVAAGEAMPAAGGDALAGGSAGARRPVLGGRRDVGGSYEGREAGAAEHGRVAGWEATRGRGGGGGVVGAITGAAAAAGDALGLTGGAGRDRAAGGPGWETRSGAAGLAMAAGGEEVCGRREFTEVEDRPVVVERVTRVVEHQPVEKRFETTVRFVGEQALPGGGAEVLGPGETRVVSAAAPGPKCPAGVCGPDAACTHQEGLQAGAAAGAPLGVAAM
ncbi:hypothetical protein HT031_002549 [Scenedesmus sp. PABB004]|nr:hypothetical protein HT031_002549 [Scenedesmus sp. PABB004]